jgi:hypothetical protein
MADVIVFFSFGSHPTQRGRVLDDYDPPPSRVAHVRKCIMCEHAFDNTSDAIFRMSIKTVNQTPTNLTFEEKCARRPADEDPLSANPSPQLCF